jgi:hypothetical protein
MRLRSLVVGAMVLAFTAVGIAADAAPARRPTRRTPQPVAKSSDEKPLMFGAQVNFADEADLGVGVRAILNLDSVQKGVKAVGSFDYYFPSGYGAWGTDVDVTYFEVNANATYDIPLEDAPITPYFGAGLNFAHSSVDVNTDYYGYDGESSNTDIGLNILGGIVFDTGSLNFFGEAKFEVGGGEQFVITGGIRF